MSRFTLLTVAASLACAVAIIAPASHTATVGSKCGGRASVLVWPHGHQVIPSVNFPAITNPHVEVYVGWNAKYPEALYGGYVIGGKPKGVIPVGDVNLRLGCVDYGTPAKANAVVPGAVTFATQTGLRCTLAGAGAFDLIERGGGSRVLILHRGTQVLLRADVTPTKASVTVPKGACAKQPVPS
jgi:hypothetical protein